MLKYLIVILDKAAASFCYYKNESYYTGKSELMPVRRLKEIVNYALSEDLVINFLYSSQRLPTEHENIIEQYAKHVKFVPLELENCYKNSVIIMNKHNQKMINRISSDSIDNIIIRLEKNNLGSLYDYMDVLINKCKRINLYLLDLSLYDESDLREYSNQLNRTARLIVNEYKKEHSVELNFISDRILLDKMKNCNAGIDHITIAPDGRFYICPGFYYSNEFNSIGTLNGGIQIVNRQLLRIENSPICSICDAYQCKRCVWLNKKTTQEINTPSYQQCNASHLERNISRQVHLDLQDSLPFKNIAPIPELNYFDPYLVAVGKARKEVIEETRDAGHVHTISKKTDKNLEDTSIKDLLIKIIRMQEKIISALKNNNK